MPVSRSILSLYVLYYYTFSFLASDDCLLTVAITAFHTPIPMDSVKDIHPENCRVEYIYWVTELTYDRSILESDKTKSIPFIVRSNVEEDGYLSFILPLLYNSTYSLSMPKTSTLSLLPIGSTRRFSRFKLITLSFLCVVCIRTVKWGEDAC